MVTLQKIFNMKSICSSLLIVTFFAVACNNPASSTTETAASSAAFDIDSVKAAIAASNQMYSDPLRALPQVTTATSNTFDLQLCAANSSSFFFNSCTLPSSPPFLVGFIYETLTVS